MTPIAQTSYLVIIGLSVIALMISGAIYYVLPGLWPVVVYILFTSIIELFAMPKSLRCK
jgi:hypothetical protein